MHIIVYDTSVIYASTFLDRDINLIDEFSKDQSIKFKTPEIVVDESINRLIESIKNENSIHQKSTQQTASRFICNGELTIFPNELISLDIEEEAVKRLKNRFEKIGSIMPYPERTHKEIVSRALNRLKPFNKEGKNGYRDTLIWETLKDLCKTVNKEDKIVFICDNSKDFYEKTEQCTKDSILNKQLQQELGKINFCPNNFLCFKSLQDFWEMYIKQFKIIDKESTDANEKPIKSGNDIKTYATYKELIDTVNKEEIYTDEEIIRRLKGKEINKQIETYINQYMFSEEDFDHEISYVHDSIDIEYIGFIDILNIEDDIERLHEDVIRVKIKCDIEYTLGIYIFKSDYFIDEEEIGSVEDWNKHYFRKEYSSTNEYLFELVYDIATSKILTLKKIDD